MKLSEKGIETIFSALLKTIEERDLVFRQISQGVFKKHIGNLEFEPDDFQGGYFQNGKDRIVLTVDEARKLHTVVRDAMMASWEIKYGGKVPLTMLSTDEFDFLCERIRQAEKCNE